jgi:hypothetical protein
MNRTIHLAAVWPNLSTRGQKRAHFALLTLGVVDSITAGVWTAEDAVRLYFHADNARFLRGNLRDKLAEEVIGRGVQLADLFNALPAAEAERECRRELTHIRALCKRMLKAPQRVA